MKNVEQIRTLREEGKSYSEISELIGIPILNVRRVISINYPALAKNAQTIRNRERNQHIVSLRKQGLTYREIASQVGLRSETVKIIIRQTDKSLCGREPGLGLEERNAEMIRLRLQRMSYDRIGNLLGLSSKTVQNIIARERPDLTGHNPWDNGKYDDVIFLMRFYRKSWEEIRDATGYSYGKIREVIERDAPGLAEPLRQSLD